MNKAQAISHNEALAVEKIRAAYSADDMAGAMDLCKLCFGIVDARAAYNKIMGICYDLVKKEGGD